MDSGTIADWVANLGALGILGYYFLHTQPRMQSEQMATFKEIIRELRTISNEQNVAFESRVKQALESVESLCRYRDPKL